jgi:hypothetical protein
MQLQEHDETFGGDVSILHGRQFGRITDWLTVLARKKYQQYEKYLRDEGAGFAALPIRSSPVLRLLREGDSFRS